jgi:hypothetical protein
VKLQLSFALDGQESLDLSKTYPVANLAVVLPACGVRTQLVKIGPREDKDREALKLLAAHYNKKLLVSPVTIQLRVS